MKAKSLAVVLFAAIGVFAIVMATERLYLLSMFSNIYFGQGIDWWESVRTLCFALIVPVILLVLGLILLLRPPLGFLSKLEDDGDTSQSSNMSIIVILRCGVILIGIFTLSWMAPKLGNIAWMLATQKWEYVKSFGISVWPQWLSVFVHTILGIYLLCGAPHLVRWMQKRIQAAEEKSKPEDQEE